MDRRNQARRTYHSRRAEPSPLVKTDVDIVQQNIQREWERGVDWACIALTLTFGPMLALGIWMGW